MLVVPGRILAPPPISYKSGMVRPDSGSWNMIRTKFTQGVPIKDWSFLQLDAGRDPFQGNIKATITQFTRTMNDCGLQVAPPNPTGGYRVSVGLLPADEEKNTRNLKQIFGQIKPGPAKMLLVVLPNQNATTYSYVKYLGDVEYGIHTVCVVAEKLGKERGQLQYFSNVALKFNLKRGGINQALTNDKLGILGDGKTMVIGIDVTHPSPSSLKDTPSIAGVVASIDGRYGQWPASIRTQESRKEMVSGLSEMVAERLRAWRSKNSGTLPTKLLVYRDGVSEGQYDTVLRDELPSIQDACKKLYPANAAKPKISIIIVGKRHHTRFYPMQESDGDRNGNPKNGTIVDRGITGERHWDFFLQAHTGLQGTARPAHYVVIRDEIKIGADALEQLVSIGPIPLA